MCRFIVQCVWLLEHVLLFPSYAKRQTITQAHRLYTSLHKSKEEKKKLISSRYFSSFTGLATRGSVASYTLWGGASEKRRGIVKHTRTHPPWSTAQIDLYRSDNNGTSGGSAFSVRHCVVGHLWSIRTCWLYQTYWFYGMHQLWMTCLICPGCQWTNRHYSEHCSSDTGLCVLDGLVLGSFFHYRAVYWLQYWQSLGSMQPTIHKNLLRLSQSEYCSLWCQLSSPGVLWW